MSRRRRAASCLTGEARPDDDGDSEVSSFDGETGRHGGAGVGLEERSADAGKKEAGIVGDDYLLARRRQVCGASCDAHSEIASKKIQR